MTEQNTSASTGVEPSVARPGGVTYLRIPAREIAQSADFYRAVFGWRLRGTPEAPSFSDGTGHVIGHWRTDLPAAGEAGVLPYIYVTSLDDTLRAATERGAELVTQPYPEGDLWVATIRDPAGNVIGVWQTGPLTGVTDESARARGDITCRPIDAP
jgi:predicted enzyme related to lactoylglutathione lyase